MGRIEIKPQAGAQSAFLATPAHLAFFGGAAYSGKTFALLMEPLRHLNNPRFATVIFRRTYEDVTKPGGLWDTSNELYPMVGGRGSKSTLKWDFPSGMNVTLAGMKDEKDRFSWQGSQVPLICFDEVTHFTANQVFYMLSRNRSASGIPGYMRFGCNPDPSSFVRELLDWWIGDDGFPIRERAGKLRWFIRRGMSLEFGDTRSELVEKFGQDQEPKSLTFIPAKITDNQIGMERDPGYLSNLKALSYVDRMQLLEGNWNVRACAGSFFRREWFGAPIPIPARFESRIRFWDRAATSKTDNNDPDATVGILMSRTPQGQFVVEDMKRMHETPHKVEEAILACAELDGQETLIGWHQDPGSAGKFESQDLAIKLAGYQFRFEPATGDKLTRAKPVSSQVQAGNVKIVKAPWNIPFFSELEIFGDEKAPHDDVGDSLSGAYNYLARPSISIGGMRLMASR